ncbi:MAG: hypothetical protein SVY53_15825 [Chloroflexota bacterium]|nr:hypothetical protein [Chloroflexota bacterium]
MVDWGEATRIAAGGFGVVILTLVMVALMVWLLGIISQRIEARQAKDSSGEESKEVKGN